MEIAIPSIPDNLLPTDAFNHTIAENQPEFQPIPAVISPSTNQIITRWKPSFEERCAIMEGEDIFITLLAHGSINPMMVEIGMQDWSQR